MRKIDTPVGGFRSSGVLITRAGVLTARLAAVACVLLIVAPCAALAAFPGRNGLLVVQPSSGRGLIVVSPNGTNARQLCVSSIPCYGATDPVWSPDGSEILFEAPAPQSQNSGGFLFQGAASTPGVSGGDLVPFVVYADGSCFACAVPLLFPESYPSWGPENHPGFLPDGQLAVSFEEWGGPPEQLGSMGVDGIAFQPFRVSGSWQQAAWSAGGELAAVRAVGRRPQVFVIDPAGGSVRRLTHGGADSPDWSPDGRRLAVVHAAWVEIVGLSGGRVRRLVRGSAPAWSPDGRKLAFVGAHGRLFVISARGGKPRRVGKIRAAAVDWQPLTGRTPMACQAPPGSSVVASSREAIITTRPPRSPFALNPPSSFLGCLTSDGRERLLESLPPDNEDSTTEVSNVALAGNYAAFANSEADPHYGGSGSTVVVFDLRSGAVVPDRGGETGGGPSDFNSPVQLVLGPDAVTAADVTTCAPVPAAACTPTEEIIANDSAGTRTLDTAATSYGAPPMLTGLSLTGDTLTWNHAGTQRTAQLHG